MKKEFMLLGIGAVAGCLVALLFVREPRGEESGARDESPAPAVNAAPTAATVAKAESAETAELRRTIAELQAQLRRYRAAEAAGQRGLEREKERHVAAALRKYEALFELSPSQRELIGELEWESKEFWEAARAGEIGMKTAELPKLDESVGAILTDEQKAIFEKYQDDKADTSAQLASTAYLSRIPVTLGLSDGQKDEIYKTVYLSLHPKTQSSFEERWKSLPNPEFSKFDQTLVWAAEGVVTDEQLEALKKALRQ